MGPNFQKYNPRFYRKKYPKLNDVVMVVVRSIAEMGVYVSLLEYGDMEGMVLLSELSRRRIRSINKIVKINKQEAVVVIRVDQNKTYIDLSKRRVNIDDIKVCEERYMKQKTVISIMKNVAEALKVSNGTEFEDLLDRTVWTLDEQYKSCGGSYHAFKASLTDEEILKRLQISDKERDVIHLYIRNRLEPKKMKIRADIEVICYHFAGIDAVKEALSEGFRDNKSENENNYIKINLIAPPLYVVTTTTYNSVEGLDHMKSVLARIESKLLELGGVFKIKSEPKVVSELEDAELARKMAELERVNAEVDGDEDTEEDEEEYEEDEDDDEEDEEEDESVKNTKEDESVANEKIETDVTTQKD